MILPEIRLYQSGAQPPPSERTDTGIIGARHSRSNRVFPEFYQEITSVMPDLRYRPVNRVKPESTYLQVVRRNVTSQAGEDGIIERVFSMITSSNKWCVEFGAWDGKHFSNTYNLITNRGWRGALIEGDRNRFHDLCETYAGNDRVRAINRFVAPAPPDTLDTILADTEAPTDLDLLSLDVDGLDWHIWQSLTDYRPRVVVIEFNPTIPNDIYFVQDADPEIHQGSSLLAMIELGKQKGYELIATTPLNAVFVIAERFGVFEIADNHIDAMHSPAEFESKLFQLYDGTLVLAGCRRLIWAEIDIEQDDIQVLPRERRGFADKLTGR